MQKQNITIAIDTEFQSSNVITGNCLQLAFVAFLDDYEFNTDEDVSTRQDLWIVDTLSVCFKDQNKEKDVKVMDFWEKFPTILNRIKSEEVDIQDGFQQIQSWLNNIYDKYNVCGFMSDLSSVDFPWFRNLYLVHCDQTLNNFLLPNYILVSEKD